jgi:hypothetical protein
MDIPPFKDEWKRFFTIILAEKASVNYGITRSLRQNFYSGNMTGAAAQFAAALGVSMYDYGLQMMHFLPCAMSLRRRCWTLFRA